MSFHESFGREQATRGGSPRSFGLTLAGFFLLVAAFKLYHGSAYYYWGSAGLIFLAVSLLIPGVLAPLSRVWLKFGLLLHRITTPIIMAVLFCGTVFPTALVMRLAGKDLLKLRLRPDAKSYWIVRNPPGPAPESLKDQF